MPPRPGSRKGLSSRSSKNPVSATGTGCTGAGAGALAGALASAFAGSLVTAFAGSAVSGLAGSTAGTGAGTSAFGGSAIATSGLGASSFGTSGLGTSIFGGSTTTGAVTCPVTALEAARASSSCFWVSDRDLFLSSSSFCRSLTFFSRSAIRDVASFMAASRATLLSAVAARPPPLPEPADPVAPLAEAPPAAGFDRRRRSPPAAPPEPSSTRPATEPAALRPDRGVSMSAGAPASR